MANLSGRGWFKSGKSGNPSGRPSKGELLRRIEDAAKEHSDEALKALIDEAKNGKGAPRVAAAVAILDRAWGKPVERKESGEPGAFEGMTDAEVEQQAKEAVAAAVKGGYLKLIKTKQSTKAG